MSGKLYFVNCERRHKRSITSMFAVKQDWIDYLNEVSKAIREGTYTGATSWKTEVVNPGLTTSHITWKEPKL